MRNKIGDRQRLEHIVEAANDLASFINDLSYEQFVTDRRTIFATVRAIEIIGEASRHVSEQLKTAYSEAAWREAAAMRNFVIHQDFDVGVLSL